MEKNKFPQIKKSISDFVFDEEGNIVRSKVISIGTMVMVMSLFMFDEVLGHSSHSSHRSHSSHVSGMGGNNNYSHGSHESHQSHQSHQSHSSYSGDDSGADYDNYSDYSRGSVEANPSPKPSQDVNNHVDLENLKNLTMQSPNENMGSSLRDILNGESEATATAAIVSSDGENVTD